MIAIYHCEINIKIIIVEKNNDFKFMYDGKLMRSHLIFYHNNKYVKLKLSSWHRDVKHSTRLIYF